MFKINRKLEYSLIALKHMNCKNPGQLTTAKEICAIYSTPFDPTSRVLQILTQHNILKAEQGARGGYQLVKDLSQVTVKELSDMIVGEIEIANCFHGDYSQCGASANCNIIAPMLNLNEKINGLFDKIKVSELIESKHSKEKQIQTKEIAA